MKKVLMDTSPDDTVVLYFCGHGETRNGLFVFADYDYDESAPEKTGITYNDMLDLLERIPARHRLILIDNCYSGAVASTGVALHNQGRVPAGTIPKGPINVNRHLKGPPPSFEMMLDIFADLNRSEGAEVIGASSGYESAFEPQDRKGAWFTRAVIEALQRSGDGLTVDQLREYVQSRVRVLSGNAQVPSERESNLEGGSWRIR